MIPKKIHYCWFGQNPLPGDLKKCIRSWKKYCPEYQIIEWNEQNFDVGQNRFVSGAYAHKAWAFVSDYARLKVIYDNGGIYLDTDVELLKSLDSLLDHKCFLATDQFGQKIATGLGFGAERHNETIKKMMDIYCDLDFSPERQKELTCPRLNTQVLEQYGYAYSDEIRMVNDAVIYPPRYFDPFGTGTAKNILCGDTISIHHYSASWTSGKNRIKRKLVRMLGIRNVDKIKVMRNRLKVSGRVKRILNLLLCR